MIPINKQNNTVNKSHNECTDSLKTHPTNDTISVNYNTLPDGYFLQELKDNRERHHKQLVFGHLNINSLRNKHGPISEVLLKCYVDIFVISEKK